MEWQKIYQDKLRSVEEAAAQIRSGDMIWMSPGCSAPIQLMEAIADRVNELEHVGVISGQSLYPFKMFQSEKYIGRINYHTIFYGTFERAFFKYGNIKINSINLSQVIKAVKEDYKINTLIADVSEPDEEGYLYFGPMGVCLSGQAAEFADKIIVQVNKYQPKVKGIKNRVHVSEIDCLCEFDHKMPNFPQPEISEVDQKISEILLPHIPDGATIQIGLGGLTNAVAYGLETKKNLSIHSEMFTDSMVTLAKKGVINGKIKVAFAMGSDELLDFLEEHVEMAPISIVNDPYEIAKNPKLISINGCLISDLTGQVCSETFGHIQYSSTGGQLDFVKGAALSEGGQSFLCMPSTATVKGVVQSSIVLNLPPGEVVTTPRTEVMNIVTEYGIANLYNKPIEERVNAMIAIAHPDFREKLLEEAINANLIRK